MHCKMQWSMGTGQWRHGNYVISVPVVPRKHWKIRCRQWGRGMCVVEIVKKMEIKFPNHASNVIIESFGRCSEKDKNDNFGESRVFPFPNLASNVIIDVVAQSSGNSKIDFLC